jgi:hypothetical protein
MKLRRLQFGIRHILLLVTLAAILTPFTVMLCRRYLTDQPDFTFDEPLEPSIAGMERLPFDFDKDVKFKMTFDQVRAMIGEPHEVSARDGDVVWTYKLTWAPKPKQTRWPGKYDRHFQFRDGKLFMTGNW